MKERIYTASVTFKLREESGRFPTLREVEAGIRQWAADWSYEDVGAGKVQHVLYAHAQRRPDLETRKRP